MPDAGSRNAGPNLSSRNMTLMRQADDLYYQSDQDGKDAQAHVLDLSGTLSVEILKGRAVDMEQVLRSAST